MHELAAASRNAPADIHHRHEPVREAQPKLAQKNESTRKPQRMAANILGAEALNWMRTIKLPGITNASATAEYFVLLTPGPKVADTKFISGSDLLRGAGEALRAATYPVSFPEGSEARIVRRGILMCTPVSACNFVLLTVETVRSIN